eukprot:scaffold83575_cov27-Tisochrysis_lutea.AAC.4
MGMQCIRGLAEYELPQVGQLHLYVHVIQCTGDAPQTEHTRNFSQPWARLSQGHQTALFLGLGRYSEAARYFWNRTLESQEQLTTNGTVNQDPVVQHTTNVTARHSAHSLESGGMTSSLEEQHTIVYMPRVGQI